MVLCKLLQDAELPDDFWAHSQLAIFPTAEDVHPLSKVVVMHRDLLL